MSSPTQATSAVVALCMIAGITPAAFAQSLPAPRPPAPVYTQQDVAAVNATIKRFGFDFVTVGAPGNRSWIESERTYPNGLFPNLIDDRGRVDYSYRIMRTEVVNTQYIDFVSAFRPLWFSIADIPGSIETGSPVDSRFTGSGISNFGGVSLFDGFENAASNVSWRSAARFANWLHNGAPAAGTPEALSWDTYHTGAYTFEERSFTSHRFGTPVTRNEDARFWLPSLDEFLKAGYYDPNRYGEGQEGYWPYPNSSDTPPTFGPPGQGDWGYAPGTPLSERLTVGRFPDTQSPWGLLDILGTATEWVETPWGINEFAEGTSVNGRMVLGDTSVFPALIDEWQGHSEASGGYAFRLATIVPPPSTGTILMVCVCRSLMRRRRAE